MKKFGISLMLVFVMCCFAASGYAQTGKEGCPLTQDVNRSVMLDKYLQGQKLYDQENYSKALPLLQGAAQAGNPNAQYLLATMHDFGYGLPVDHVVANEWYLKAAQQSNDDAQYNLGISYQIGEGIEKNMDMSVCWIAKAAANGDDDSMQVLTKYAERYPEAMYALAQIYRNGVKLHNDLKLYPHEADNSAIKPDMQLYKSWLQKAAGAGHAVAAQEIKTVN